MYKPLNTKFHQTVVRQRQMKIIKSILVESFEIKMSSVRAFLEETKAIEIQRKAENR